MGRAITTAVGDAGGVVMALDVVESRGETLVVDMACNAFNEGHAGRLEAAVEAVGGAHVKAMSDRTLLLHLGGKLEIASRVPLRTRDDLSMAYTPGVARVSMAIAKDPSAVRNLTIKRNTVAVVTDGSAVLGLGNIGPEAAMPVMEGKALLFKRFAGVDAWPICLATQDADEIVRIVECIAPGFGGINLEDIAAPRCFEVEERLRERLDIPVFHDDQHGTAVVVFAALTNALRVVGKQMKEVRVVVLGIGAAGVAVTKLLLAEGVGDVVALNRRGILAESTPGLDEPRRWIATHTNCEKRGRRAGRGARGRRRPHRRVGSEPRHRGAALPARQGRHRVRPRQSHPGGRLRDRQALRRHRRHRAQRRAEPDQQRARLSGVLPGSPERRRPAGHRRDEAGGGPGARRRRRRGRALARLYHPDGLQPRRRPGRLLGRRTGRARASL